MLHVEKRETNFFSAAENLQQIGTYERHFPVAPGDFKVVGEYSPSYMMDQFAPERIAEVLGGDVKFLFVLRNPAKRTVSAYWHCAKTRRDLRRLGDVLWFSSNSIDDVLREESQRLEDGLADGAIRPHDLDELEDKKMIFRYLENSLYTRQVDRFLNFLPRESIHLIILEELGKHPNRVLSSVSSFLEIPNSFSSESIRSRRNKTVIDRNAALRQLRHCVSRLPKHVKAPFQGLRTHYSKLLYTTIPETPRDLSASLSHLFQPEITYMSELLGRDLSDLWGSE